MKSSHPFKESIWEQISKIHAASLLLGYLPNTRRDAYPLVSENQEDVEKLFACEA